MQKKKRVATSSSKSYFADWSVVMAIVVALVVVTTAVAVLVMRFGTSESAYQFELEDGWTVYDGTETLENVVLEEYILDQRMDRGDAVMLTHKIPQDIPWGSMLRMETTYCVVDVYVGKNRIYSYGHESYESGDFVGAGIHFVDLPDNSAGQTMQIVLVAAESDILNSFYPVEVVPEEEAFFEFGRKHLIVGCVGIFLVVLGILALILGVVVTVSSRNQTILLMGGASFLLGLWTIGVTKTLELFTINFTLISEIEHLALFFLPIPVVLLIMNDRNDLSTTRRRLMQTLVSALFIFVIIAIALHYSNTIHLPRVLTIYHVLLVIALIIIFVAMGGRRFKFTRTHFIITVGLGELVVCGVIEIIRYNMQKFFFSGGNNYSVTVLPFGMLAFIATIAIAYYIQNYEETLKQVEQETWHRMAYTDALTDIGNRAKAEEAFEEMDQKDVKYTVVSIDLNNLKLTNDNYGHEAGDTLLMTFSNLLRKHFPEDVVARMGGDEFLILSEIGRKHVEDGLERICEDAKEESLKLPYPLEFAFGVATSDETEDDSTEAVFGLADARMYEHKREMKQGR